MTVKVLYIVGKGRSGSTILDHTLGQQPGFASTGELWHLWEWGIGKEARCGCGTPIPGCPVWAATIERLRDAGVDPATAGADQQQVLRWPMVPKVLMGAADGPTYRRHLDTTRRLYEAIADARDARVVVDSSKWPAHPGMLGHVDRVEPTILHLIRDPRAVAYSYRRHKTFRDHEDRPTPMPRFSGWHSGLSWTARNLAVELARSRAPAASYLQVRYEDLVSHPRTTIRRIVEAVGEPFDDTPFVDENTIHLEPTHTVGGNPSKFTAGTTEYRLDDEWRRSLPAWHRLGATLLTLPLLGRYGYPVRAGGRASTA